MAAFQRRGGAEITDGGIHASHSRESDPPKNGNFGNKVSPQILDRSEATNVTTPRRPSLEQHGRRGPYPEEHAST